MNDQGIQTSNNDTWKNRAQIAQGLERIVKGTTTGLHNGIREDRRVRNANAHRQGQTVSY